MGMSASQARLLSITTRLTNNEFRSQMTANARVRLADKTQAASQKYMDALESTKLVYSYYDANGDKSQETLTANVLTFYQPLKNQYGLINNAGQIMVNHNDATTFTEARHHDEFLVLNDCATMVEKEVIDDEWLKDWKKREPLKEDYTTYEEVTNGSNEIYDAFMREASGCYGNAKNGKNCYMHVLASMLGPGKHTTSGGDTFEIFPVPSGYIWDWYHDNHPMPTVVAALQDQTNVCCGEEGCPDAGKSIYQAAVDLLWDAHFTEDTTGTWGAYGGLIDTPEEEALVERFFHLIDHDLKQMKQETVEVFDEEAFNAAHAEWENEPPVMKTVSELEITDPDKAEWYSNLWYRMNGAMFDETLKDDESNPKFNILKEKYFDKTADHVQSWVQLEDNLLNSPEWLRFALESGAVRLERVNYQANPDTTIEMDTHEWSSVTWSSTTDISEIEDTKAIARAEAVYTKEITEIQAEDKKLENDIKKLDTEHNALQTEYDSIKGVMDKNMERSFKAFS